MEKCKWFSDYGIMDKPVCFNPQFMRSTSKDGNPIPLECSYVLNNKACGYFEEETKETHNPVNHPNHYCQGGIECIKAIEAAMPPEGFQDYCKGNVLKYLWRWRDKAGVEDLKKAKVYLEWLIESAEKENKNAD